MKMYRWRAENKMDKKTKEKKTTHELNISRHFICDSVTLQIKFQFE